MMEKPKRTQVKGLICVALAAGTIAVADASGIQGQATGTKTGAFIGARTARGIVFWDENDNGEQNGGEAGVPGIRLTALHRTALTDESGRYEIASGEPFVTVSLSFPSEAWPTAGWFRRMTKEHETGVDFGLRRDRQELPFVFVQFTDPHGHHPVTMKKVLEECEALPLRPKFYVCTGDLRSGDPTVRNVPDLERSFGAIGKNFEAFGAPLFMVPGNHDTVGYGGAGRLPVTPEDVGHPLFGSRCWERYVCPGHWSFSCGGVHLIGVEWAQHTGQKWRTLPPGTAAWVREEAEALPPGTRTVLFGHNPGWGRTVVDLGLALGLFGHSHTEGQYYRPGSAEPSYPESVLVGGLCQTGRSGERHYMAQDGRPMGYRIVVVERDRLDTFYKAFGEPRTIMVQRPRRFMILRAGDAVLVRGQFFDPRGEVTEVNVRLGGRERGVPFARRRLWGDFEVSLDVGDLPEGFHDLTVTTLSPEGTHSLTEPYLFLTGRQATFSAEGPSTTLGINPATLRGGVRRLEPPCAVLVNGQHAGLLQPASPGQPFSLDVPPELLKRLNRVSLAPEQGGDPWLAGVHLEYGGEDFVDQHRAFRWGYDPSLTRRRELYFDLHYPGPTVQWQIR